MSNKRLQKEIKNNDSFDDEDIHEIIAHLHCLLQNEQKYQAEIGSYLLKLKNIKIREGGKKTVDHVHEKQIRFYVSF